MKKRIFALATLFACFLLPTLIARADISVVQVRTPLATQTDIQNNPEHLSMDENIASQLGLTVGMQVRIYRNDSNYALYTLSEVRSELMYPGAVRISLAGRQRMGTSMQVFTATANTQVVHPSYTEQQAQSNSEFIEELSDGSEDSLIVLAPHGGGIESWTDEQAERVVSQLGSSVTLWTCKGWKQPSGSSTRWHISSTDISDLSFPRLETVSTREYQYAISFHGMISEEILIGGRAPDVIKNDLKAALDAALSGTGIVVRIATYGEPNSGTSTDNIVNWITADGDSGIQIEQGKNIREQHWMLIADTVASVISGYLN